LRWRILCRWFCFFEDFASNCKCFFISNYFFFFGFFLLFFFFVLFFLDLFFVNHCHFTFCSLFFVNHCHFTFCSLFFFNPFHFIFYLLFLLIIAAIRICRFVFSGSIYLEPLACFDVAYWIFDCRRFPFTSCEIWFRLWLWCWGRRWRRGLYYNLNPFLSLRVANRFFAHFLRLFAAGWLMRFVYRANDFPSSSFVTAHGCTHLSRLVSTDYPIFRVRCMELIP